MENLIAFRFCLPGLLIGAFLVVQPLSGPVLGPLPTHPGIREIGVLGPMVLDSIAGGVYQVQLVNMIPALLSGETENPRGADLAVNPAAPADIVAGAYPLPYDPFPSGPFPFPPPSPRPLFVSRDGGSSWAQNPILQIPDPSPWAYQEFFRAITLEFAGEGGYLYAGIEEDYVTGPPWNSSYLMRSPDPFGSAMMTQLTNRGIGWYLPHLAAITSPSAGPAGVARDRVFAIYSNYYLSPWWVEHGRTTSLASSPDARNAAYPDGFSIRLVQSARARHYVGGKEPRVAVHPGGTVYGLFYGLHHYGTDDGNGHTLADVVVIRDDSFGEGAAPFTALTDPSDGLGGRMVEIDRRVRTHRPSTRGGGGYFGPDQESDLALAVNPRDAGMAYVVWADSEAVGGRTLHVRRTTDRGANWGRELLRVPGAVNPALAIAANGAVGLLYQRLVVTGSERTWQTVFRKSQVSDPMHWSEFILCKMPEIIPSPDWGQRRIWSNDLEAIGDAFYGVFCENNVPDLAHFPHGVRYQRNADFPTRRLLAADGSTEVAASMDPFFFKITPGATIPLQCALPAPYNPCSVGPFFDVGRIVFEVDKLPYFAVDPLSRNCLVKFNCPGCRGTQLCPPYHHLYLEGLDPKQWDVGLYDEAGQPVKRRLTPFPGGVIVTFKPDKARFRQKNIGEYRLAWASKGQVEKRKYDIKARLEVSDSPKPPRK